MSGEEVIKASNIRDSQEGLNKNQNSDIDRVKLL
jgi:hypothetical protein